MGDYKGKIHETIVKHPNTDIWLDSCAHKELEYMIDLGGVGATSNPIIVGQVVKKEMDIWDPILKEMGADREYITGEELTWELINQIGRERSKLLMPIYEKYKGKKGRLSIQVNAKYYRDAEEIIRHAKFLNSLGENMQIKMPVSEAGIIAIEETTYQGISINATVSFTVSQAIAVAEAVERGLTRREEEGLSIDHISSECTIMLGRTDDWIKTYVNQENIIVNPECLEWTGIAVTKKAYKLYKERGYRTRLLVAGYRNHYHWSQLIGGDMSLTITDGWLKKLGNSDVEVVSRIDDPVDEKYLNELKKISEFNKVYYEDGMEVRDFEKFGAFRITIRDFIGGYEDLVKFVREYMI